MNRVAIAMLVALLASPVVAGFPNGTMSSSWGGYMQTACSPNCTSIQATTRLPAVSKTAATTTGVVIPEFATWIGIGNGPGPSNHLMQSGIIPLIGVSQTAYWVFYECYNNPVGFPMPTGTAYPGDVMVYTQTCNANCTAGASGQTWNFSVQDVTQGWTYSTPTPIACVTGLDTAEVVAEAVTQGSPNQPRALQFGDVPFTSVKLNGATWSLLTTQEIYGITPGNDTLNPSDPSAAGDGFKVCYGNGGAYTACPNTPTLSNVSGGRGLGGF